MSLWSKVTAPLRTSFARHAGMLSGGQFAAAALSILGAPVLGRIYPPQAYGVLASYMAVAGALGAISNWQYSQAIVTESSDRRAFALVTVCLYASLVTAALSVPIAAAIVLWPGADHALHGVAPWFLLLPATVVSSGMVSAWSLVANRLTSYRVIAVTQAIAAVISIVTSIALGLAGWGVAGLMLGYFASQAFTTVMFWRFWRSLARPRPPRFRAVLALGRRHRHFALWTMPSSFIGQFAAQIPIYTLGIANSLLLVGAFSRGRQLLLLPLGLIGQAIAQVFRQRAAADMARQGNCLALFYRVALGLLLFGLPPTILLMATAPWLFRTFLGPNWTAAGEMARILAPMLLLQLIASPIATVYYIAGRQAEDAWIQLGFAIVTALFAALPLLLGWPGVWIVFGYTMGQSAMYLVYLVRSWLLAHGARRSPPPFVEAHG